MSRTAYVLYVIFDPVTSRKINKLKTDLVKVKRASEPFYFYWKVSRGKRLWSGKKGNF